jgi:methionyl aminopeptidase
MIVRTPEERAGIIEAGKRLGEILEKVGAATKPGVSTLELDALAEKLILENGDETALKGYRPDGARIPYPATICISINDEVVHGIPAVDRVIKEGDIVGLDLVLAHDGYYVDSAYSVAVGKVSAEAQKLLRTTQDALEAGIFAARPEAHIGDISHAVEASFKGTGIAVVKLLGGHGVGKGVHEEPYVSNAGTAGTGPTIVPGMVLAIEPIANAGKASVVLGSDGYTYRTRDGALSAHFEHSILIEEDQTIVLTRRPHEKF